MPKGNPNWKVGMDRPPGSGRAKGVKNRRTVRLMAVRDMVLDALDRKGGVAYLEKLADEEPAVFVSLLARILPKEINLKAETDMENKTGENLLETARRIAFMLHQASKQQQQEKVIEHEENK